MPRSKHVPESSAERYRELLWTLTQKALEGPDYERWPGYPHAANAEYKVSLDRLGAIAKSAQADKQLEDLAAIQRRLREAETVVAEMMRATADERHHRADRVEVGRAVGDGKPGSAVH